MSSPKGRVLGSRSATRPLQVARVGVCAWCGADCVQYLDFPASCATCASTDIDWIEPPATPLVDPTPHQHIANTHVPGSIAFSLLGGFVRSSGGGS